MEYVKVKGKCFGDVLPADTFWYVKEVGTWTICSPHIMSIWKDIKNEFQDVDFYTLESNLMESKPSKSGSSLLS